MPKRSYQDYLTLFHDAGWELVYGSRWGGTKYFRQTRPHESNQELFSDQDSRISMYKRYQNYVIAYGVLCLCNAITLQSTAQNNGYHLFDYKTWYLTPGLWEKTGSSFWFAFIFETPFAIWRSGIVIIFFILWSLYLFYLAYKSRKEK